MSKTDKTTPWKVFRDRGECNGCGYPCKHLGHVTRRVEMYRRKYQRHERTQLRVDLAAGREPETYQHRHRAKWEAW